MCHYLLIEGNVVFDLLDINCYNCMVMGSKWNYNHHHWDGCYDDSALIPVLYFIHFIAKWEWMYQRLLKFWKLWFFKVDESWPYRFFSTLRCWTNLKSNMNGVYPHIKRRYLDTGSGCKWSRGNSRIEEARTSQWQWIPHTCPFKAEQSQSLSFNICSIWLGWWNS